MEHKAKKLVIITEAFIAEDVAKLIEQCGATGYTTTNASGKGSRGVRSSDRTSVSDAYSNVKFEIILGSAELADEIAEKVVTKYFKNYSGIIYAEEVDILRPQKFLKS